VTFAGQVGGALHVVIRHADGVRTSYSFLATIAVAAGDHVTQGDIVGTSGPDLHFGARVADRYVDPEALFGGSGPPAVHLVPNDAAALAVDERAALLALTRRPVPATATSRADPAVDPADIDWALARLAAAWR
jgi:murein DD-endopeptidase MepM/ murein hydrolase activator NlpD